MARSKLFVVGAVALTLSLLSGGVAVAALSESEWEAEATVICTDADLAVDAAANAAFSGLGPNDEPTPEQLAAFAGQIVPIIEGAVQDLVDLDEPKSKKKNLKKWAKAARAVAADIEDDPTILLGPDPFAKANKLAKKLGLQGCE